MTDIVHHQSPPSIPFLLLPLPARDFEGVGAGATAFQTTVSDDRSEGNADERLVMTNKMARARRLFRSRKAASLRRGLRKSRKVRLLVVIVGVQLDRVVADQREVDASLRGLFSFLVLPHLTHNDGRTRLAYSRVGRGCPDVGEQ